MKPIVRCLVLDLDNTLFDWVDIWHRSFSAMLAELVNDTGLPQEQLEKEFRQIHQERGTSEYAFSLEELPSLRPFVTDQDSIALRFEKAIKEFRFARAKALALYPGVQVALETIKAKGCLLVGYTESMQFYTNHRVRNLGLDVLLDYIYSPHDHALPSGMSREKVRKYPSDSYRYRHTLQRYTPPGEEKPNPQVLKEILRDVEADPATTVYVGDSLMKDVDMALKAGLTAVWAKYGIAQDRPEYALLRRVTHWTEEMVEREKSLSAQEVEPTYTLEAGFIELLDLFDFTPFKQRVDSETAELQMEMWKKTIDVQQHFNDIALRIRNFAVTISVGVVGAVAVTMKEKLTIEIFHLQVSLGVLALVVGIMGIASFWFMDRLWYHRFLVGAVKHGSDLEKYFSRIGILPSAVPGESLLGLTQMIGRESPVKIFGREIHSKHRLDLFYGFLISALAIAIAVLLLGAKGASGSAAPANPPSLHVTTKQPASAAAKVPSSHRSP